MAVKKSMRRAAILVKLETTQNTDSTPTGAANAIFAKNFNLTSIDGEEVEHEHIRPSFGNFHTELATSWSKVDFDVYYAGSGEAGVEPHFDALLQSCGCAVTVVEDTSVTYSPVSEGIKTVTIYVNIDGVNHKITGARGNVTATTDAKGLPILKFTMTGLFNPVDDVALPTAVYANYSRARPVNKANTVLTLHGVPLVASNFGFDFGNQVVYDNLIGQESVEITDRKSTYSATFDAVAVSVKNWPDVAQKGTTGALSIVHGNQTGNIVTFSSAIANVKKPSIGNRNNVETLGVTGNLVPSAAGGDEWSLVFT